MRFGYTLSTEQAGFDFEVMSGGSTNRATRRRAEHACERVELMTFVTCPILRCRPAVVPQKTATVQLLSGGRFLLGLGTNARRLSGSAGC